MMVPTNDARESCFFLYPFKKKDKYGYINRNGEVVVPAAFSYARPFSEGYGIVSRPGEKIVFSFDGKLIGVLPGDSVGGFHCGLASYKVDGKWGYINRALEICIDPQFDVARDFVNGLAIVENEEKWGVIDICGHVRVNIAFDRLRASDSGLFVAYQSGKGWGFVDCHGQWVIDPKYRVVHGFSEGLAAVTMDSDFGFINPSGEWVIDPVFSWADGFSEGASPARLPGKGMFYIDKTGAVISPSFTACQRFSDRKCASYIGGKIDVHGAAAGGHWKYFDRDFNQISRGKFDGADPFEGGLGRVYIYDKQPYVEDAKMGYVDLSGKWVWRPTK